MLRLPPLQGTHRSLSPRTLSFHTSYDANGNMIQKSEGSNFWRYTWDHENRLTKAISRKQTVQYKYDALGRRVAVYAGVKGKTKFTYDGADVLLDDLDGTQTKYLNGPGVDSKLRSQTGTSVSYFLSDHLGSINGLTDSTGAITASNSYDSFGKATNTSFPSRYQFTGREVDSTTGLYYYRARWYDAGIGRFISEDPIGLRGGINLYGYVGNSPGNFVDPSGLFPQNYGDPFKFWTNGADQLKGHIEDARRALTKINPDATDLNTDINFAARILSGTADLLTVGSDLGKAIFCTNLADYRRLELVSNDVVRGGTLFLMMAGPAAGVAGRLGAASGPTRIPWDSWPNYPKVTIDGEQYAQVGNRLYTEHAVNRMQPSGMRYRAGYGDGGYPQIRQTNGDYGRGVAPQYVEDAISSSEGVPQPNGNISHTSGSLQVILNTRGDVVTIITH